MFFLPAREDSLHKSAEIAGNIHAESLLDEHVSGCWKKGDDVHTGNKRQSSHEPRDDIFQPPPL